MNLDPTQMRHTCQPLNPLVQNLLHAMGQPLTSLQMCVLLRDRPALDRLDFPTLLDDMADQVILLSRLFGTLQRVLDSEVPPARITAAELELLLPSILPQWRQAALQRDITLLVTGVPPSSPTASRRAPRGSIDTCLQEIVAAALESTPDRGSITVTLAPASGATPCQLRIAGGNLLSEASFPGRFALPAAKTLLDSTHQVLTYSFNPFKATFVLLAPALLGPKTAVIDRSPSASEGSVVAPGLPG